MAKPVLKAEAMTSELMNSNELLYYWLKHHLPFLPNFLPDSNLLFSYAKSIIFLMKRALLKILAKILPTKTAYAHCDLPCGVYNPLQARIEAESILNIMNKYNESKDEIFRVRAIHIKEERAELVKHHLWVLWTDYFKPEHLENFPELHDLFWRATKQAGQTKKSVDPEDGEKLLEMIDKIDSIFKETKRAK